MGFARATQFRFYTCWSIKQVGTQLPNKGKNSQSNFKSLNLPHHFHYLKLLSLRPVYQYSIRRCEVAIDPPMYNSHISPILLIICTLHLRKRNPNCLSSLTKGKVFVHRNKESSLSSSPFYTPQTTASFIPSKTLPHLTNHSPTTIPLYHST